MVSVLLACMLWDKPLYGLLWSTHLLTGEGMCFNKMLKWKFLSNGLWACTDVGVFSKLFRQTSTCMCSTNSLSYTHPSAHTLWKTCWQKNLAGNENFPSFAFKIIFRYKNTARLLYTIADCLTSGISKQNVTVSLIWGSLEKCMTSLRWRMLSVLLACMRWFETLPRLIFFNLFLSWIRMLRNKMLVWNFLSCACVDTQIYVSSSVD
jgi:hypothetical protein